MFQGFMDTLNGMAAYAMQYENYKKVDVKDMAFRMPMDNELAFVNKAKRKSLGCALAGFLMTAAITGVVIYGEGLATINAGIIIPGSIALAFAIGFLIVLSSSSKVVDGLAIWKNSAKGSENNFKLTVVTENSEKIMCCNIPINKRDYYNINAGDRVLVVKTSFMSYRVIKY